MWRSARASTSARAVSLLVSGEFAALALVTVQALVVARYLGPTDYGRVAVASGLIALLAAVLDLRSTDTVTRFLPPQLEDAQPEKSRRLVGACVTLDAATAAVAVGVMLLFRSAFEWLAPLPIVETVVISAGVAAVPVLTTARAALNVLGSYRVVAGAQTVSSALRLALLFGVVAADAGLLGVVTVVGGGVVAETLLTLVLAGNALKLGAAGLLRPVAPTNVPLEIRSFVGLNGAVTAAGAVVKAGDVVLVGAFSGPAVAGYYRLAKALTSPIGTLALPLTTVFYNRVSAAHAQGQVRWGRMITRAQIAGIPLVLLIAGATPFLPALVALLAGDAYAPAGPATVWLALGGAAGLLTYWARPVLLVLDELRMNLYISIVVAAGFAALAVPAAMTNGAEGVAVTRLLVVSVAGSGALVLVARAAARRSTARAEVKDAGQHQGPSAAPPPTGV